jgi:Flp pilus assembly protein TadD
MNPARRPTPLSAQQLIQTGQHHHAGGNFAAAVELFGAALQCKPREPMIRSQLAQALQHAGRHEEARLLARQNAADGGGADGQYLLALVLSQQRRYDEAVIEAERALSLRPQGLDELLLLSALYPAVHRWDDARRVAEEALRLHPQRGETQRNYAIACLIQGDFAPAWKPFEHRPDTQNPPGKKPWRDQDPGELAGKTIVLWGEGGFGDQIQLVRYVGQVKALAKRVIVVCKRELVELFRDGLSVPADDVIPTEQPWPDYDLDCALWSLPLHFGTTLATVPREVPYLLASVRAAGAWEPYMRPATESGGELKVGLVWAGSNVADKQRFRTLLTLAPLAAVPGVRFFSLQKGPESWQAAAPPDGMNITDFMPRVRDFADLAGVIAHLDLVIGIDTAVPHLAGAMGKEVWTFIPYVPEFRWMLDRSDTPWYPTMRLYRQTARSDWSGAVAQVVADLHQKLSQRRRNPS